MIFVDSVQFPCNPSQVGGTLDALLQHPALVGRSETLKGMEEFGISNAENSVAGSQAPSRSVYVFQREYATVIPRLVDFVGTDEATTCVGFIIRDPKSGMTSLAHMDSPNVVTAGLTQMLSEFDVNSDVNLDVHLVGGFNDVSPEQARSNTMSRSPAKRDGYSISLCTKIIEALGRRQERFHVRTLLVLGHNTKMDSLGNAHPIFTGFVVEISTGSLIPATFDRTTRCPDEIIRRIRVTACCEDPDWDGKLLETYDTQMDQFVIAPCCWTLRQLQIVMMLWDLPDTEILLQCSTSPFAEAPEFVDNLRRQWKYLMEHPKWQDSFPRGLPRFFARTNNGTWERCFVSVTHTT